MAFGRFCIWTQSAFEKLDGLFGSNTVKSTGKAGFSMPRHMVVSGDIARVINSDQIQSVIRPSKTNVRRAKMRKNPLKNLGIMVKLNPYALTMRRAELIRQSKRSDLKRKGARTVVKAATKKARKAASRAFRAKMMEDEESSEEESSEEEEDDEEEEEEM